VRACSLAAYCVPGAHNQRARPDGCWGVSCRATVSARTLLSTPIRSEGHIILYYVMLCGQQRNSFPRNFAAVRTHACVLGTLTYGTVQVAALGGLLIIHISRRHSFPHDGAGSERASHHPFLPCAAVSLCFESCVALEPNQHSSERTTTGAAVCVRCASHVVVSRENRRQRCH
jgi:hypothetical protein